MIPYAILVFAIAAVASIWLDEMSWGGPLRHRDDPSQGIRRAFFP